MRVIIKEDYREVSREAAGMVAGLVKSKPCCTLGLATGSTPLGLYNELVRLHRDEGLSFARVKTFNLDEYYGLAPEDPRSYRHFMDENLFGKIDIRPENTSVPDGRTEIDKLEEYCTSYEEKIRASGGIDLQVLGIGSDGHIAFNEPGSSLSSRTRIVSLDPQTIRDNSRFFNKGERVPEFALSMGVGTILESREILFLASGEGKAEIVARALEGPVTSMVTASALQLHPKVSIILDSQAAGKLRRLQYYRFSEEAERKIRMPLF